MTQRGQATAEFVVLAIALVPLLLIVPLLGKYLDTMQAAEAASRYVAFQGTVHHSGAGWRSDTELAEEVRRRFFSNSDADVKTGDVAGDFDAHRNLLWRDHAGRPLLDNFASQVSLSTERASFNFFGPTRLYWHDGFRLPDANFYSGTVTVSPRNVPGLEPFDAIDLRITRRAAVLVDAWSARSPVDVQDRIERNGLHYPTHALHGVLELMGESPRLLTDPPLRPGLREWELVPCDRLAGGC